MNALNNLTFASTNNVSLSCDRYNGYGWFTAVNNGVHRSDHWDHSFVLAGTLRRSFALRGERRGVLPYNSFNFDSVALRKRMAAPVAIAQRC